MVRKNRHATTQEPFGCLLELTVPYENLTNSIAQVLLKRHDVYG